MEMAGKAFCYFRCYGWSVRYRYFYPDQRYYQCSKELLRPEQPAYGHYLWNGVLLGGCYYRYSFNHCGSTGINRWLTAYFQSSGGDCSVHGTSLCGYRTDYFNLQHYKDSRSNRYHCTECIRRKTDCRWSGRLCSGKAFHEKRYCQRYLL